jgi:hypothetical protein
MSSSYTLHANEVKEIFQELPAKLTSNAVIYLDACLTGSLKDDFYNNMQFAFAKLTAQMPDVTIVAPCQESATGIVEWRDEQGFYIESTGSVFSPDNISITLGKETKKLIKNAQDEDIELNHIQETLLQTLQRDRYAEKLIHIWSRFKGNERNDVNIGLIDIINANGNNVLEDTRYFVEELCADGQAHISNKPRVKGRASPLFAAIHIGNGELVSYLLEHGADPRHSFNGTSPKAYAEKRHQHEIAHLL